MSDSIYIIYSHFNYYIGTFTSLERLEDVLQKYKYLDFIIYEYAGETKPQLIEEGLLFDKSNSPVVYHIKNRRDEIVFATYDIDKARKYFNIHKDLQSTVFSDDDNPMRDWVYPTDEILNEHILTDISEDFDKSIEPKRHRVKYFISI
jgi:hypothetical protein